jgi:hypothetical protein
MGRQCVDSLVLRAFHTDPRILSLAPAAAVLWLRLVNAVRQLGQSALLFGDQVPELDALAALFGMTETETETQFGLLQRHGLIRRRDDGAWSVGLLAQIEAETAAAPVDRRKETAPINGLRGGRPRKGKGVSGQRTLLLPIAGGGAAAGDLVSQTQIQTQSQTLSQSKKQPSGSGVWRRGKTKPPASWLGTARQALDLAGLDGIGTLQGNIVCTWLRRGATPELIVRTIRAVLDRPGADSPHHLGYFDAEISAALEQQQADTQVVRRPTEPPAYTLALKQYLDTFSRYVANGACGEMPPKPELADYLATAA